MVPAASRPPTLALHVVEAVSEDLAEQDLEVRAGTQPADSGEGLGLAERPGHAAYSAGRLRQAGDDLGHAAVSLEAGQ